MGPQMRCRAQGGAAAGEGQVWGATREYSELFPLLTASRAGSLAGFLTVPTPPATHPLGHPELIPSSGRVSAGMKLSCGATLPLGPSPNFLITQWQVPPLACSSSTTSSPGSLLPCSHQGSCVRARVCGGRLLPRTLQAVPQPPPHPPPRRVGFHLHGTCLRLPSILQVCAPLLAPTPSQGPARVFRGDRGP